MSNQTLKPVDSSRIHPLLAHHTAGLGADRDDIRGAVDRLIHNLVNIEDQDGKFLLRLDDGRVLDTKGWNGFEWTHGVGLYGVYKVWELTGDPKAWDIMTSWFEARFAEGMPSRNINTVAPFLTLAYLFDRTGDRRFLPYIDRWAEWVYNDLPRTEEGGFQHIVYNSVNHQQLWDDTLMMSVLPLAKFGLLLNRPHYVEEAKRQFLVHIKYLADRKTGLWFHGWTFEGRHNFANALWARGNSWVTIVIPEFIELLNLPEGDAFRQFLVSTLEAQVKALAACQSASGLWPTLLDDPTSYDEAAASAGFAYGILKAVRKGYLPKSYEAVGLKAALAVRSKINDAGELTHVSFGHAGVQHAAGIQGHPADVDALRPGDGAAGDGRAARPLHLSLRCSRRTCTPPRGSRTGSTTGAGARATCSAPARSRHHRWLFYFFTTFCGLSAVEAGLILGLPRLLEAITCPLIGYVSDNLRHTWVGRKIGRRKVFLLITIPLLPSFALIFRTGHSFTYYLLAFIFFELLYTMFLIPWETLAAEMTKDYKRKAKFAGARMIVAQSSAILASYLPTLLISRFGGKDSPDTFFWMAAIFGVIFSIVVTIVVLTSWERPYGTREQAVMSQTYGGVSLKAALALPVKMFGDLFSTLKIRAFRQHLSIYLGGYLSQDIFNTAFPIFVATVLMGATLVISQLMTVMYVAQLISVMVAIQIVIRTGPVLAYRLAISLFGAALLLYLGFYLVRPEGFEAGFKALGANLFTALDPTRNEFSPALVFWLFLPIVLAGLGRGTLNFVPWSVYNYLPDIDEAVTGQRREGIFAGVMTLVRKLAQSAAIIATGWIIDLGGYISPKTRPGEVIVQSAEAIQTITLLMVGGPLLMMLLGLLASWRFRLNASTHAVLVHEVERLRNGATEAESDANRQVVEDLTGWPYDRLWGRGSGHAADSALQPLQARP